MAYSRTRRSIDRVRSFLDAMLESRTSIEWPADEPEKLSFHIREAIAAAKAFAITDKETFSPYASLAARFIIKCKKGRVVATPRETYGILAIQSLRSRMQIDGVFTLLQVLGAAIQHRADEMIFPQAENWSAADVEKLYKWSSINGYFIIMGDGITLTKNDPGEVKWEPKPQLQE